MYKHSIQ